MVTVVRVTPIEAAALAATESWSSAEADSNIKNAPIIHEPQGNNDENRGGNKKHAVPPGDSINGREMKKRLRPIEAMALAATESWSSAEADSVIKKAPIIHAPQGNNNQNCGGNKKRALPSENLINGREMKKRHMKAEGFSCPWFDVVPQLQPVPKSRGRTEEWCSSKYTGVHFDKSMNKWQARIMINGEEDRCLGFYENEEDAAAGYARAFSKYKVQEALKKAKEAREQTHQRHRASDKAREPEVKVISERQNSKYIDLSDVPSQPPIPKGKGKMKEGSSKDEEEAAVDYSRAVFKYRREEGQQNSNYSIDLRDVPPQPPIPKSKGLMKEGSSKYTGVFFFKSINKWQARIELDGKFRSIGYYETEKEAAVDYARAVFKYRSPRGA